MMFNRFYEECLKFWERENVPNPEEKALQEVKWLKNNPFSPAGEPVDEKEKQKFIDSMK